MLGSQTAAYTLTCLGNFGQQLHQPKVLLMLLVRALSPATEEENKTSVKTLVTLRRFSLYQSKATGAVSGTHSSDIFKLLKAAQTQM